MQYHTYCLQSEEGYHYTGHTQDLDIRMLNQKLKTTHYTKKGTNCKFRLKLAQFSGENCPPGVR